VIPIRSYNPSLCQYQGRVLISYRHHSRNDWRTELGIAELDAALKPIANKPLVPPDEFKMQSLEDLRFCFFAGKPYASFTVSQYPAIEFRAIIVYGELVETDAAWTIPKFFIPAFGKNDFTGTEKNWLFWEHQGKLFCLYLTNDNEQIILELDGARVEASHKSKALPCPWGTPIHGGAICEGENGNLLHFWNSHTAHRDRSLDRYLVGVAELSGVPPFDMVRISKRPILVGEEGACLDRNPHYKNNVCFVCGAMKTGENEWIVSFGRNDAQACLVKLRANDLKL
jgi:predicted GH43/DUF377 family glycosyl hydrolase